MICVNKFVLNYYGVDFLIKELAEEHSQQQQEELGEQKEHQQRAEQQRQYLNSHFSAPLSTLIEQFSGLQRLVEHVLDLDQLPALVVSPRHDPALMDLHETLDELQSEAEGVRHQAASTWAAFADIRLECNGNMGYFMRATKGDDERGLREGGGKQVEILSLQKVQRMTTSSLCSVMTFCVSLLSTLRTACISPPRTWPPYPRNT